MLLSMANAGMKQRRKKKAEDRLRCSVMLISRDSRGTLKNAQLLSRRNAVSPGSRRDKARPRIPETDRMAGLAVPARCRFKLSISPSHAFHRRACGRTVRSGLVMKAFRACLSSAKTEVASIVALSSSGAGCDCFISLPRRRVFKCFGRTKFPNNFSMLRVAVFAGQTRCYGRRRD